MNGSERKRPASEVPIDKLLQNAFKGEEWEYLSQNKGFQGLVEKCPKTLAGYENLVQAAVLFLRQRENAKRQNPSLN